MGALPASIGPYRIVRLLGEGGMGSVFEAIHDAIERRVAIKLLKPDYAKNAEAVSRFFNEARAVNRIEHPSLVQVSDYGQTSDGAPYLVMEYLRGETLRARLDRLDQEGRRMALEQVVHLAWQLAEALSAAHQKGVVHRDLKPDNLMLISDPAAVGGERAKILDFGIAKLLQTSHAFTVQPRTMGTPKYMAPEQIRADQQIDGRADVYSLGIVLYEMLAGQPPFVAEHMEGLLGQHLFSEPAPLASRASNTPPAVASLVHRLLEKTPAKRPTMQTVVAALAPLLTGGGISRAEGKTEAATKPLLSATPMGAATTLGRMAGQSFLEQPRRRSRLLAAMMVGMILGGSTLVGAWLVRRTSSGQHRPLPPDPALPAAIAPPSPSQTSISAPVEREPTIKPQPAAESKSAPQGPPASSRLEPTLATPTGSRAEAAPRPAAVSDVSRDKVSVRPIGRVSGQPPPRTPPPKPPQPPAAIERGPQPGTNAKQPASSARGGVPIPD